MPDRPTSPERGATGDRSTPTAPRSLPDRLPVPGASFLREHAVNANGRRLRAGLTRPTTMDDGWWLAVAWVADDEGVVSFVDLAPPAGPRPEPPLVLLGPTLAGGLSGLILEDAGHLEIRVATVVPAPDPARPWRVPAAVRMAFRWEPMRAAAMRPNELADTVLAAFRRAAEDLGHS